MNDNDASEINTAGIARKSAQGIFWSFLTYGLSKSVVLVTTSILARLLSKDDFGVVAIAVVAINYLAVIKDLGLGAALIQQRHGIEQAANTVFTFNLLLGVALSILVFPLAPLMAAYFDDPLVAPVLRWLGLSFLINSLGSVHGVLLIKDLDYRKKLIPDLGSSFIKALTSIGLALGGFGVWSLVFGQLASAASSVILLWIILPWRPRFFMSAVLARVLMKFGLSVIGGDLISVAIDNLGYVLIGRLFGLAQLSIYTLAYRLPEMLLIGNLWVMAGVTFPAFSTLQAKPEELKRGYLASIRLVSLIALPLCLGLLITAEPIIKVFFGNQWLDAIPILRVLAVYAWVLSVGYHIGDIYKAIGRPDILMKLTILTLILVIPALLIGSRFGLVGVAWGYVAAILVERFINLVVSTYYVSVSLNEIFKEFRPAFIGCTVMTPIALSVLYLTGGTSPVLQLAAAALAGMLGYTAVLWLMERESLIRMMRLIRVPGQ